MEESGPFNITEGLQFCNILKKKLFEQYFKNLQWNQQFTILDRWTNVQGNRLKTVAKLGKAQ